jgi:hypothetical protein
MQGSCAYERLQKCLSAWLLGDTVVVFTVLVSDLWPQGVQVFHFLAFLGVSDLVSVIEGNARVLCV